MSLARVLLLMNSVEDSNPAFADRDCTGEGGRRGPAPEGSRKAAGELNDWMRRRGYSGRFTHHAAGVFFMITDAIDLDLFMVHLHMLPWQQPQDVQVVVKGPTDSRYQLWELKLDYFADVQEFLNSAEAKKPEVRAMIEDAILLKRGEQPAVTRKIRRDVGACVEGP